MTRSDRARAMGAPVPLGASQRRLWLGTGLVLGLLLFLYPSAAAEDEALNGQSVASTLGTDAGVRGPTLHLTQQPDDFTGDPIASFLYFISLISLEPVKVTESPQNTQRARLLKSTRHLSGNSLSIIFEFALTGQGFDRHAIDHTQKIRRNEEKLRKGVVLDHQLGAIQVEGSGTILIEVEGRIAGSQLTVNLVRVRFRSQTGPSPVSIDLYDLRYVSGELQKVNQIVARVDTLTFRRHPGPAKMDLSVASVQRKGAGDSSWEYLVGKVKAAAANLVLEPVDVASAGNEAMLEFGLALATQSPEFTFPFAKNLR